MKVDYWCWVNDEAESDGVAYQAADPEDAAEQAAGYDNYGDEAGTWSVFVRRVDTRELWLVTVEGETRVEVDYYADVEKHWPDGVIPEVPGE